MRRGPWLEFASGKAEFLERLSFNQAGIRSLAFDSELWRLTNKKKGQWA